MRTHNFRISLMIAIAVLCSGSLALGEQIDNPGYGAWARFKPGSTQKTTTSSTASTVTMTLDIEYTLEAVTPEKVTLTTKTNGKSGDTKLKERISKRDVPAKVEKPPGTVIKHSTEDVTLVGKTYKCSVSEETREGLNIKTWTSDEVPGGVVKATMVSEGLSVSTLLVEAVAKK